jgi:hypothetical protein
MTHRLSASAVATSVADDFETSSCNFVWPADVGAAVTASNTAVTFTASTVAAASIFVVWRP